jgi:hypothetical protein
VSDIGLIVADPGHFHAALVQREMYPNLSPEVHAYAPVGPDLIDYLTRISRFNTRPERPTRWGIEVHACPDFLERMCRERPGTVAMFSGRNRSKIQGILAAIEAGINVLADKPLIIRREDLSALETGVECSPRSRTNSLRYVVSAAPGRRRSDAPAARRSGGVW